MIIDFASCFVTGGEGLRARVESAAANYDTSSAEYFESILSKRGEAFCDSACGFLLLDNLALKHKIPRGELIITTGKNNRPISSLDYFDFSISHSEGCAVCAVGVGEGALIGCDVQRVRDYSDEKMTELAEAFMNGGELRELKKLSDKSRFFFTAWTRRESYVKRAGIDIFGVLKNADLSAEYFIDGVIRAGGTDYLYSINCPPPGDAENEENT